MTAVLTAMLGIAVLAGWLLHISWLKSVVQGAVEMKANTAIALVLASGALYLLNRPLTPRRHRAVVVLALLVSAIGWATLSQYLFGWRLGIDELLFLDRASVYNVIPGRMSPYSALAFGLLGIALWGVPLARHRVLSMALALLVLAIGVVCLLGYAWNASELVTDVVLPPVAVHTAFGFALLGLGLLLSMRAYDQVAGQGTRSRMAIEIKAAIGFISVLAMLVVAGGISYRTSDDYTRSAEWVARSQYIRTLLSELYETLAEAASSSRTYVLTRDPHYKELFLQAAGDSAGRVQALEHLMLTSPQSQKDQLDKLDQLRLQRLTGLEMALAEFENRGPASAQSVLFRIEQGVRVMAALRSIANEINNAESFQLIEREVRSRQARQNTLLFLVLTLALSALTFGLLLHGIRQEMMARALADGRLKELNLNLEKRVEERSLALAANQRRLIDLFEHATDPLLMVDATGRVLQMNHEAERAFGWARQELIGRPVELLLPHDLRAGHVKLRDDYLRAATPRKMAAGRPDLHGLRKDGTQFPVDVSLSPLGAGEDFVVVAAVRDISDRERMNEALRNSVALYRQTLDNMLEGCQILDTDWRYRYINEAAQRHNRQSASEMLGRTMMECFPGIEETPVFARIRRCMVERIGQYADIEFVFPDGYRGWFEVAVQPTAEGVAVFSMEVTERRHAEDVIRGVNADLERRVAERTEELMHARQAAEAANQAKSAFLATMSHEIRTPMNGVIGMVEVLASSPLPEHQADAVRTIRTSAFALLDIIDDILDFSKIEAGRLELEHAPVALGELVESVCDTLLPVAIDRSVELSMFVSPQLPDWIMSDATRLRQLLFNLAGNAIKFGAGDAQRHGHVSVRVDFGDEQPPRLRMRFIDDGIGMSEETLEKLFTSFTQAEVTTTRRFGGTGLGLAISRRLVTLMDGEIAVHSELSKGSTFTVQLPCETVPGSSGPVLTDITGVDCVLIGNDAHADDLRAYLEHGGAHVHRVDDLGGALAPARRLARPVVIQNTRGPVAPTAAQLHEAFAGASDARHLLIVRGWGRRARMTADDIVTLDGNCLRRALLLRAVAVAAGRASPETLLSAPQDLETAPTAPTHTQARVLKRLVLIAEDDEVNQKVILRQMEILGHAAEIAEDGNEALRMWREGQYALLLSDLHMPDMDGYELAETIRREEAARGVAPEDRMPILALTANALRGEALRAQAAGMDEYLTKPLQLQQLGAALRKWLPHDPTGDTTPGEFDPIASGPVIDLQVLRTLAGPDGELANEFLDDFLGSARRLASELRNAHAAEDHRRVAALAHRLKSAARTVGAMPLGDQCADLENACRTGTRSGIALAKERFEAGLMAIEAQVSRRANS
jgi:PAS domain S-box-containing protein